MRALVTGANGFLGLHLCEALLKRNDFVVALSRDYVRHHIASCDAVVFGGFDSVERAIAEYEIDTVFHLAAQTQVSTAKADPVGTLEANIAGTWKVLEACRRQKVKRVIIASSDKVYGRGQVPYSERNNPILPHGIYATSKACADMLAFTYAREFNMTIAITRCGNLYGPGHTNWSTLIPGTIKSLLQSEVPVLRSNGKSRRDFLFVEDAVEGYLKLADALSTTGDAVGAFNFGCGGRGSSVLEVVDQILDVMGLKVVPIVEDNPFALEIDNQILDYSKATQVLGWGPKHTLEQGLAKTIEWYREYLKESL